MSKKHRQKQRQGTGMTLSGTIPQIVDQLYEEADTALAARHAAVETFPKPEGRETRIACKRGCGFCCTYVVQLSEAETIHLADAIEQLDEPKRTETIHRIADWVLRYRQYMSARLLIKNEKPLKQVGNVVTVKRDERDLLGWQSRRYACPVLNVDTLECGMYDERPMACRTHVAMYLVPENAMKRPDGRPVIEPPDPPDACITTSEHVKTGLASVVFTPPDDLHMKSGEYMDEIDKQLGLKKGHGVMPMRLWEYGTEQYGWKEPRVHSQPPIVPTPWEIRARSEQSE
jgi:Fe-S-cluster containining protein